MIGDFKSFGTGEPNGQRTENCVEARRVEGNIGYTLTWQTRVRVHLVLHPHEIAPTFLKLHSWSLGAGFIRIISTKGINQIKKEKS